MPLRPSLIPLSRLLPGHSARVVEVAVQEVQVALLNMGIAPGDVIEVANLGPGGDPLAIRSAGTKLAFRKVVADSIYVEAL